MNQDKIRVFITLQNDKYLLLVDPKQSFTIFKDEIMNKLKLANNIFRIKLSTLNAFVLDLGILNSDDTIEIILDQPSPPNLPTNNLPENVHSDFDQVNMHNENNNDEQTNISQDIDDPLTINITDIIEKEFTGDRDALKIEINKWASLYRFKMAYFQG